MSLLCVLLAGCASSPTPLPQCSPNTVLPPFAAGCTSKTPNGDLYCPTGACEEIEIRKLSNGLCNWTTGRVTTTAPCGQFP